jgi:hypothetical protein
MTLQPLPSEFPDMRGKFSFFISVNRLVKACCQRELQSDFGVT